MVELLTCDTCGNADDTVVENLEFFGYDRYGSYIYKYIKICAECDFNRKNAQLKRK